MKMPHVYSSQQIVRVAVIFLGFKVTSKSAQKKGVNISYLSGYHSLNGKEDITCIIFDCSPAYFS